MHKRQSPTRSCSKPNDGASRRPSPARLLGYRDVILLLIALFFAQGLARADSEPLGTFLALGDGRVQV